jgi:hypothetical protein
MQLPEKKVCMLYERMINELCEKHVSGCLWFDFNKNRQEKRKNLPSRPLLIDVHAVRLGPCGRAL